MNDVTHVFFGVGLIASIAGNFFKDESAKTAAHRLFVYCLLMAIYFKADV